MADLNSDKLRPEESEGGFDADPSDNQTFSLSNDVNRSNIQSDDQSLDNLPSQKQESDPLDELFGSGFDFSSRSAIKNADDNKLISNNPIPADSSDAAADNDLFEGIVRDLENNETETGTQPETETFINPPIIVGQKFEEEVELQDKKSVLEDKVSSLNEEDNNNNNKLKEPGNMKKGIIIAFAMLIFVVSLGLLAYFTLLKPKSAANETSTKKDSLVQLPQSQDLTMPSNGKDEVSQNATKNPEIEAENKTEKVEKPSSMKDRIVEVIKPSDLVNKGMDSSEAAKNIKKAVESKKVLKPHKPPLVNLQNQPKVEAKPLAQSHKNTSAKAKKNHKPAHANLAANTNSGNKPVEKNTKESKPATVKTTQDKSPVFTVQIYTTPSRDDAEEWIKKLRAKNINSAYLVTHKVRDKIWYRVRFGQFVSFEEAKTEAVKTGYSQSWIDRIR